MANELSRRAFLGSAVAATGALTMQRGAHAQDVPDAPRPNVLFIMTDQQRFDTISALGNEHIYTPNMDWLARRGVTFTNAYSTCPVCVPSRYTIRTGRFEPTTGIYHNGVPDLVPDQPQNMEDRCGPYLPRTMSRLGYRTFGIGKFHTHPWDEDLGYEVYLQSCEMYGSPEHRARDAYASFIAKEHPEYDFIEALMGERTEMYYMPQMSPLPAALGVEAWAADRAVEQIRAEDVRPYFGFVSLVGPHPPLAPPLPFNRMYDPDRMPNPIRGDIELDHMDEQIPWMNYAIWAEDINDPHARVLKARYYGELSYIDQCIGRILDAVDARSDADNTVICFFSDHGDHLGDHHAWQKESYFEAACHVPFLVSWPARLPRDARRDDLVCLADLFAIATGAAGALDTRDGIDVLGVVEGKTGPRKHLIGLYGIPGTSLFKLMVRQGPWKYVYMANGGREQLFNVAEDPHEQIQRLDRDSDVAQSLRTIAESAIARTNVSRALENGHLISFPFQPRPLRRIYQFDGSRGVRGFPAQPQEVLAP